MILYENSKIVVIATFKTTNNKTGNMAQIWILNRNTDPITSVKTGEDRNICGNCKHRGSSCYVNVAFAPNNIYKKYIKNGYKYGKPKDFLAEDVRFGAYGDPALIPFNLIKDIAKYSNSYTGYTHQWLTCDQRLKDYLMASVDTYSEMKQAQSMGWKTFRILGETDEPELFETKCPSDVLTCRQCKKCDGKTSNIYINVHGPKHKIIKFNQTVKGM